MIGGVPLTSAIFSAFLGAITLRTVERIEAKRSGLAAVHHDLITNFYRLQGEIEDIRREKWSDEYTRVVQIDGFESVKSQNPRFYRSIIEEVDDFTATLAALENIRFDQTGSRQPGAYVPESPEEVHGDIIEIQKLILDAEENLQEFRSASLYRRLVLWRTIETTPFEPELHTHREL